MNQQFETLQKFGKSSLEANLKTLADVAEGAQAVAAQTTDYVTKSLEQSNSAFEKLAGVRSLDKAIEVQSDYAKQAYEGFVAQTTRTRELYAQLAKKVFDRYQQLAPVTSATPEQAPGQTTDTAN